VEELNFINRSDYDLHGIAVPKVSNIVNLKRKNASMSIYQRIYDNLVESNRIRRPISGLHKHHITPEHRGGTNEESNFTFLTVREHTLAHFLLWKIHRDEFDRIAYRGLGGIIPKEEIIQQQLSEAGKRGGDCRTRRLSKEKLSEVAKTGGAACWKKHKEAKTITLRENAAKSKRLKEETGRGLGGLPQNKWMWITDGVVSKKTLISDGIPDGFRRGRLAWKKKKILK
jgi:hypothetical protein